jgi:integrase
VDTGCRRGELLKLRWRDVDLHSGKINIIAFNTKTAKARCVAVTSRLRAELEQLRATAPDDASTRVFGVLASVKRSFAGARNDAGLPALRVHDLRHSAATRLVRADIPLSEVGRILGHQQPNTTYRYVNADIETANRAAAALDRFNALPVDAPVSEQSDAVN